MIYEKKNCLRILGIALFGLLVSTSPSLSGQITNVTDETSTPVPGAGHNYIHALNETVDPSNGSVSIAIDVPVPASRGVTLPFSFTYNSNQVFHLANVGQWVAGYAQSGSYFYSGGWAYSFPILSDTYSTTPSMLDPTPCMGASNYVFADPGGGGHSLYLLDNLDPSPTDDECAGPPSILTGNSLDGYSATLTNNGLGRANVSDPDGTVYTFNHTGNCLSGPHNWSQLPSQVEDRNGNIATFSYDVNCTSAVTETDSAGRATVSTNGFGKTGTTVAVSGMAAPYTLTWGSQAASFSLNWEHETNQGSGSYAVCVAYLQGSTVNVVQQLTLPNGQSYKFYYDATYGLLNKIVYPGGGYVQYTWGVNPLSEFGTFAGATYVHSSNENNGGDPTVGSPFTCGIVYDRPVITQRLVSFDGTNIALEQDFSYATDSGIVNGTWSWKTTTVKTVDRIRQTTAQTNYTYSSATAPLQPQFWAPLTDFADQIPVESEIDTYDWSGALLLTVNKLWLDLYAMTEQDTTVAGNTAKIVYPGGSFLPPEIDEYDFGQSSPSRVTKYTYQSFSGTPGTIVDRTCTRRVTDGNGNLFSETDNYYDGGNGGRQLVLCASDVAGGAAQAVSGLAPGSHDETNYGPSTSVPRGNVTQQVEVASGGTGPASTYTYDETGQIVAMTDPCGNAACNDMTGYNHTTTYSYTDNPSGGNAPGNSNAYLTAIGYPATATRIQQNETFSYNYALGYLTTSTDRNSESTHYIYNTPPSGCSSPDGLDRLSEVDAPDGGKITYCYNDAALSVATSVLLNSGTWKTTVAARDGMGHETMNAVTSDPYGPGYVYTSYDGKGNVYAQTNRYRSMADSTYGSTIFYHDAVGRTVEQQNPDGSVVQTCYNGQASVPAVADCIPLVNQSAVSGSVTGTWVDATDGNGNHWQRASDAFGRLTQVAEPSGAAQSPTMLTTYSYDPLGNLLSVVQNGASGSAARTRTFNYDSLSRLIQTYNPESGWTCYGSSGRGAVPSARNCTEGYDLNGNLGSKVDARGVQTTFTYDVLNRVVQKSYTDAATATACYLYDSSLGGIGRLAAEWTQPPSSGACSPSFSPSNSYLSGKAITSYDSMGRRLSEQQYTPWSLANGTSYPMAYTYDLAGDPTSSTAGASPAAMTYASPSAPCAGAPAFNTGILTFVNCYDAAGRLQSVTSNAGAGPATLFAAQGYTPSGALTNATYGNNAVVLSRVYDNRLRVASESDLGSGVAPGVGGSSAVTIVGAEGSQ